jgi:hypothetical protein
MMKASKNSETVDRGRRNLVRSAVLAAGAAQFGSIGTAEAQASQTKPAPGPSTKLAPWSSERPAMPSVAGKATRKKGERS